MKIRTHVIFHTLIVMMPLLAAIAPQAFAAPVKAWEGELTLNTYPWRY